MAHDRAVSRFRRLLPVIVAGMVCAATGCSGAGGPDACALIDGKTFVSVNQMECGLSQNGGLVYCNWSVRFSDGTYFWHFSDVAAADHYSCDGATITAIRGGASTTPLLGRVDPQTGQLTWDGATYVAQ